MDNQTKRIAMEAKHGIDTTAVLHVLGEMLLGYVEASFYLTCKELWETIPDEVHDWFREHVLGIMRKYGRTSCEYTLRAAETGQLHVLKWLRTNRLHWSHYTVTRAVMNGHLDVVKWCIDMGCEWHATSVVECAALKGDFNTLEWLYENDYCRWSTYACICAAKGGHLEVLKWLRAKGCPWDEFVCLFAFRAKHFHVLEWAKSNGCDCRPSMSVEA